MEAVTITRTERAALLRRAVEPLMTTPWEMARLRAPMEDEMIGAAAFTREELEAVEHDALRRKDPHIRTCELLREVAHALEPFAEARSISQEQRRNIDRLVARALERSDMYAPVIRPFLPSRIDSALLPPPPDLAPASSEEATS